MKKTFKLLVWIVLGNFYLIACSSTKKVTTNEGYTPIVNEKNDKDTLNGLENGYSSKKKIELIDQQNITHIYSVRNPNCQNHQANHFT